MRRPAQTFRPLIPAMLLLMSAVAPGRVGAQGAGPSTPVEAPPATVADSYTHRLAELRALGEGAERAAEVSRRLVLTRDVATFTLESGRLYVLPRVGGRRVAVAFKGRGTFAFAPPSAIEQAKVAQAYKGGTLAVPVSELVLLFSDSTLAELEREVSFAPATELPGELKRRVREMLDYMSDPDSKTPDPDVMGDLLNGTASDLFYAHVGRDGGDPVMFMLDPYEVEGVRLLGRARRVGWMRITDVVSQFRRQGDTATAASERWRQAEVRRYVMDVSLPRSSAGEVGFVAAATLELAADQPVGPWIAFALFPKLQVDSARWSDGTAAIAYKAKDSPYLWLRTVGPLGPGETRTVTVYYHGDLIDRYSDFFFIKSSIAWYPVALEGRTRALFDLTFRTPRSFTLASVGERVDSAETPDRMVRTRWVTAAPIRNASFNLGLFQSFDVPAEGIPPVSILYSDQAHRSMMQNLRSEAQRMRDAGYAVSLDAVPKAFAKNQVGEDVANAMKFFQHVFGEVPVRRFYATEIPYSHGEAFPGLVHLSLVTFIGGGNDGFDEFFRAHEVAHQWWGIAVDYATYHDRWLSEGFASFAGLWYMQTVRKDNKKYFGMLDRWRSDILLRRKEREPISLGHRVASASDGSDYNALVYEKGAWVVHMLRLLMLDLRTMSEDRFTQTMQDFYATYRGKRASTEDFRRVVERHMGMDMRWFFDQWVYGADMPTYRVTWQDRAVEGGKHRVHLTVRQENVPADFQMWVPVTLDLGNNSLVRLRVKVQGPITETDLPPVPSEVKALRFNDLSGVLAEVK